MQPRTKTVVRKAVAIIVVLFACAGCRFAVDQTVDEVAPKVKEGMTLLAATRSVGRKPNAIAKVLVSHLRNKSEPRETHAIWDCADGKVDAYIAADKVENVRVTRYP